LDSRRLKGKLSLEKLINIHIERLPEGYYLATSEDVQGLVAQGRTVNETLEIARDVARELLEAQSQRKMSPALKPVRKSLTSR
jgi:predicted RNase H-like HicB family nuclease